MSSALSAAVRIVVATLSGSRPLLNCGTELIIEAIVVGEARRYLTVLIEPSPAASAAAAAVAAAAAAAGAGQQQPAAKLAERLRAEVDRVNTDLARVEQLKDFRVLPRPLAAERGELTANGKVRRAAVVDSFAALIDEMYRTDDEAAIAKHMRSR
ncbi:hypothetical protein [Catenulispora pinisilvae]|uniref:hypothetical protein n=1 Tax=Catenulispora pinisilvae TaxID=2705253 RepID=UPI00189249DF|nr:hypothetical protein [Catenulispora pinisilvae]